MYVLSNSVSCADILAPVVLTWTPITCSMVARAAPMGPECLGGRIQTWRCGHAEFLYTRSSAGKNFSSPAYLHSLSSALKSAACGHG